MVGCIRKFCIGDEGSI